MIFLWNNPSHSQGEKSQEHDLRRRKSTVTLRMVSRVPLDAAHPHNFNLSWITVLHWLIARYVLQILV